VICKQNSVHVSLLCFNSYYYTTDHCIHFVRNDVSNGLNFLIILFAYARIFYLDERKYRALKKSKMEQFELQLQHNNILNPVELQ
jgi:hypothetical protein